MAARLVDSGDFKPAFASKPAPTRTLFDIDSRVKYRSCSRLAGEYAESHAIVMKRALQTAHLLLPFPIKKQSEHAHASFAPHHTQRRFAGARYLRG
jgi:hypothetical protein